MILKRILLIVMIICLVLPGTALAEETLSVKLKGGTLDIEWTTQGQCLLTVYRNKWPVLSCNVDGSEGGKQVAVSGEGSYSVRLKTSQGCLSAEAMKDISSPSTEPTSVPSTKPTEFPTGTLSALPTTKPTLVPTERPTPVPLPEATPIVNVPSSGGQSMTSMAAQVISMVNAERAKYGLQPLSVSAQLTGAACIRAQEIAERFSHTRPDGSSWSTVSSAARGENIAKGHDSAERVMAAWMSSDGHRRNILRESFGSIGVCALMIDGVVHWVQLFGN